MQASSGGNPDPDDVAVDARVESLLRGTLFRFDCPDALTLGEYQLALLSAEQRTRVAAHAAECDACGAELRLLRTFLATPLRPQQSLSGRARRLVAELFVPATPVPGLAFSALRGSDDAELRVFQTDGFTVTVGPGQQPGTLIGILVATTPSDAVHQGEARLIALDGNVVRSNLDDLGNFAFERIPEGRYALEVDLVDSVVVVQELHIR
jgi:hypothetical protein